MRKLHFESTELSLGAKALRRAGAVLAPIVSVLPLRPLSRVASDYLSDSVVCIEILRPLRPLREIKITSVCFHAKSAKSAEIYSLSYFTLALEWSQTSLRQECAESLSTPSPLRGTTPVSGGERTPSIPLQGEESVTTDLCPHYTYCPPETGRIRPLEK